MYLQSIKKSLPLKLLGRIPMKFNHHSYGAKSVIVRAKL